MAESNDNIKLIEAHFRERASRYDNNQDWVKDSKLLDSINGYIPIGCEKVLELGAGTGVVSKYLLDHRNHAIEIYDVDISPDMLNMINDERIKKICCTIEKLPFEDDSFDAIVSRQCLHYVIQIEDALNESYRVLQPGGIFVLAQIVPYNTLTAPEWKDIITVRQPLRRWFFSIQEWNQLFKKQGFKIIDSKHYCSRGSVKKWAEKYCLDYEKKKLFADKLLSSSNLFKSIYNVVDDGNDITYNSFWHIAIYKKQLLSDVCNVSGSFAKDKGEG